MLKTTASKTVYSNKWMTLVEDQVEFENGRPGIYSYVEKPPFALIIPHQNGIVSLVKQFRYPIQAEQWEFPQGALNDDTGAEPLRIAETELREETGLIAGSMTALGSLYPAYGLLRQEMFVFLAEDLTQTSNSLEAEEEGLVSGQFSVEEVREMIRLGIMQDGCSVSAMFLWDSWIRENSGS